MVYTFLASWRALCGPLKAGKGVQYKTVQQMGEVRRGHRSSHSIHHNKQHHHYHSMAKRIRLRWEGNNSRKFDGVTQDLEAKHLLPADRQDAAVGKVVRVKWGRGKRLWRAIVVDLLDAEEQEAEEQDAEELAEPPSKKRK